MNPYKAIPVATAKAVADQFDKDIVIILGWNNEHHTMHTVTYGKSPDDKIKSAAGGEKVTKALGLDLDQAVFHEDFRRNHNAAAQSAMKEAIEKHLPA